MKKLLLTLVIFLPLIASAQMDRFFYGNKWSDIPVFRDSLLKALPGYKLDSISNTKNGDAAFLSFNNPAGKKFAVKIYKRYENNTAVLGRSEIKGYYAPLLAIYKHYFNPDPVIQKTNCFPEIRKAKLGDKIVSVSFCPLSNITWLLVNRDPK